jgi:hypothetical protein
MILLSSQVFGENHPLLMRLILWLVVGTWRLLFVLDIATDAIAANNVFIFDKAWGFFLGLLLVIPYVICAFGIFNVFLKELPKLVDKYRLNAAGLTPALGTYILLAPLWVLLLDIAVTVRFFFIPTQGHYPSSFVRMRRIAMVFIDAGLTTIFQLQVWSSNITGVNTQFLGQAVALSMINIVINVAWLYHVISKQHRPWTRYIRDSFRAGLSSIPQLDELRDGVELVEIDRGIEHWTDVTVVTDAIDEAGVKGKLRTLSLQRCHMDNDGANVITNLLLRNTTIVELVLDYNEVRSVHLSLLVVGL